MTARIERRRFLAALAAAAPAVAWPRVTSASIDEGIEYRVIKPALPVDSGDRIQVIDFFQYSCPHCFAFLRGLQQWRQRQADAIDYRHSPIHWDDAKINHTRMYFALERLGRMADMHERVFREIHIARAKLDYEDPKRFLLQPEDIAAFMAANGIDRSRWSETFGSAEVDALTAGAAQAWRAYRIDGTPAVAIDGKFVTSPTMAGSRDGALALMDILVRRAQQERVR